MVPVIASIISFIQLAIKAAPLAKDVYDDGRALINEMFSTKLITAEQQAELMTWADEHERAVLAGEMPPEFKVEPPAPAPETPLAAAPEATPVPTSADTQPPVTP